MPLLHMTSKNKILILPLPKVSSKKGKIDIGDGTINPYFGALKRLLTHICEVGYYPHFVQEKTTQGYITCAAIVTNREFHPIRVSPQLWISFLYKLSNINTASNCIHFKSIRRQPNIFPGGFKKWNKWKRKCIQWRTSLVMLWGLVEWNWKGRSKPCDRLWEGQVGHREPENRRGAGVGQTLNTFTLTLQLFEKAPGTLSFFV